MEGANTPVLNRFFRKNPGVNRANRVNHDFHDEKKLGHKKQELGNFLYKSLTSMFRPFWGHLTLTKLTTIWGVPSQGWREFGHDAKSNFGFISISGETF